MCGIVTMTNTGGQSAVLAVLFFILALMGEVLARM